MQRTHDCLYVFQECLKLMEFSPEQLNFDAQLMYLLGHNVVIMMATLSSLANANVRQSSYFLPNVFAAFPALSVHATLAIHPFRRTLCANSSLRG